MNDYISRVDLLNAFGLSEKTRKYGGDHSGYDSLMLYEIQDTIENMESADVRENIHGHWISHKEHCEINNLIPSGLGSYIWCSECDCGIDSKYFHRVNHNFCPNCGADMREVSK